MNAHELRIEAAAKALYECNPNDDDTTDWPKWEDLPADGNSDELGCNTQAEFRVEGRAALQAADAVEPELSTRGTG